LVAIQQGYPKVSTVDIDEEIYKSGLRVSKQLRL